MNNIENKVQYLAKRNLELFSELESVKKVANDAASRAVYLENVINESINGDDEFSLDKLKKAMGRV
jgi:hypothetical protein